MCYVNAGRADYEEVAIFFSTVSALPDFVRPLNLQLSIKEPALENAGSKGGKAALE